MHVWYVDMSENWALALSRAILRKFGRPVLGWVEADFLQLNARQSWYNIFDVTTFVYIYKMSKRCTYVSTQTLKNPNTFKWRVVSKMSVLLFAICFRQIRNFFANFDNYISEFHETSRFCDKLHVMGFFTRNTTCEKRKTLEPNTKTLKCCNKWFLKE